jgi:hypothetical protein
VKLEFCEVKWSIEEEEDFGESREAASVLWREVD